MIDEKMIFENNSEPKPETVITELVMADTSEKDQLRSDVEFLSMMTGIDLGGD